MATRRLGFGLARRLRLTAVPAALFALFSWQGAGATPLSIVSVSVARDLQSQTVTFAFTFDRAPDFGTYDAYGRQADSFWVDILNNPGAGPVLTGSGGEDIRILGEFGPSHTGSFAITAPRPSLQLLDLIPYQQSGAAVTFSTTFAQIGETDGEFEAILFTMEYGAANPDGRRISGPPIPEAGAFVSYAVGLGLLAVRRVLGRARC